MSKTLKDYEVILENPVFSAAEQEVLTEAMRQLSEMQKEYQRRAAPILSIIERIHTAHPPTITIVGDLPEWVTQLKEDRKNENANAEVPENPSDSPRNPHGGCY